MKKCKLPFGTVVTGAGSSGNVQIKQYLMSCDGIKNTQNYAGSSSSSFGLDFDGNVCYIESDKLKGVVANTITYEEFKKLIAEPELETYNIF